MNLVFFSCLLLVSVGLSFAFIPGYLRQIADWSAMTHRLITRSGLWSAVIDFLQKNPEYANREKISSLTSPRAQLDRLRQGVVPKELNRLVKSSKFDDALKEIEVANVRVDSDEETLTKAHFDAEQFVAGSRRLVSLKKRIIALINEAGNNEGNYATARKEAGRYLHTLQDFYSHSNWIEIGNRNPLKILGDKIISERYVAEKDQKTCESCTSAKISKLFDQTDDCENNLILEIQKFTSGYFGGQDVTKPSNVGKCSHGGVFDSTRDEYSTGGINKDSTKRSLSPHYRLHTTAATVAIEATKLFFDGVRDAVGDKNFAKFLNMEEAGTLSFAIDTTGSMSGEIASVQKATVQFIEASEKEDETIYYVLVPFNDPGYGPAYVANDPDVAKRVVNSLRASGGGDCPELGMSGLYLALTHSLPNSDVYYFSDASAKDANLRFSVLSIALQKQCRITFFVSGSCTSRRKRRSLSGTALYQDLATSTGGQFLQFSKSGINDAIRLLRRPNVSEANSSVQLQEVSLLTIKVNELLWTMTRNKPYYVRTDSSIVSMTVILSADASANIIVTAPPVFGWPDPNTWDVARGRAQTGQITIISQTTKVYGVRISSPMAGNWKLIVTASGSYSLQVTAQSSLAFESSLEGEEYSSMFGSVLVPLSGSPIKGRTLFVTVVPTEQDLLLPDKNLTAHVIDTAGNKLDSFDLERGELLYNNSYYGSVKMKFAEFRLIFLGQGMNGEVVQRVLPRLIKPQEFEIKVKLFAKNSSFVISPNEKTTFTVTLNNYGSRQRFSILASDERSFVQTFSPSSVTLSRNGSVDIRVNLLAPYNTKDSTTSSVSISASVSSSFGSSDDLANYLSLQVSVFSKKFLFINDTELEAKNLTSFLIPREQKDDSDTGGGLAWYIILVIVLAINIVIAVVILVVCKRREKLKKANTKPIGTTFENPVANA